MHAIFRWLGFALLVCLSSIAPAQDISGAYTVLPDPGAIAHNVAPRLQDATMVTDFCTPAAMSTDATACLQAAIHAVCTRTGRLGGMLYLPAGSYTVQGTVNIECQGMSLMGAGQGDRVSPGGYGTLINAASTPSPTAPVFSANLGATYGLGFVLRDMMIYNSNGTRSGAFLDIRHWGNVLIDNVQFYQPCTAVRISGGNTILIQNSRVDNAAAGCDSFYMTGNPTAQYQQLDTVSFSHTVVSVGNGGNCYRIADFVQTSWWSHTICETRGRAIYSTCSMSNSSYCPGFFTLYDFEAEQFGSTSDLIELHDTVDGFKMSDSWLRAGASGVYGGNAVFIENSNFPNVPALQVNLSNNWIKYSGGACVYLRAGRSAIIGNHIYGCNQFNIGASGVELRNSYATINGNVFCGDDFVNDITWPMKGGYVIAGIGYNVWTGNVFSGNQGGHTNGCTEQVYRPSPGPNTLVADNVGP